VVVGRGDTKPEAPSAPGWYPDPWSATGTGERYFDGKRWGSTERPRGRESVPLDPVEPEPPTRSGRGRTFLAVLLVAALAGVAWFVQQSGGSGGSGSAGRAGAGSRATQPPPGAEEASHRLLPAVTAPAGEGGYAFAMHQQGDPAKPVAFDPCRPVHYVVNLNGAPADGLTLVQDAVAAVSTHTGLKFVYDGQTTEAPDNSRAGFQPATYGSKRWAPVLIAWSDERAYPALSGYILGVGGGQAIFPSGRPAVIVSGQVVLDREDLSTTAMPDRGAARATVLHELGHLVGLDHIADRSQLMFSEAEFPVRDFGPGDLRGLARVGDGPCAPGV
jgi:uncharacterized protein DUF2510